MSDLNPLLHPENVIPGCKVETINRLTEGSKIAGDLGEYLSLYSIAMLATLSLFPEAPHYYYIFGSIILLSGVIATLYSTYCKHDTNIYWFRVSIPDESLPTLVKHYYIIGMTDDGKYDILPCTYKFKVRFTGKY